LRLRIDILPALTFGAALLWLFWLAWLHSLRCCRRNMVANGNPGDAALAALMLKQSDGGRSFTPATTRTAKYGAKDATADNGFVTSQTLETGLNRRLCGCLSS
jgi:hypothetical protein